MISMPSEFARALSIGIATIVLTGSASGDTEFLGVNGSNLVRFNMTAQTTTIVGGLTVGGNPLNVMQDCDFDAAGQLWAVRQGNAGGFPPNIVSEAYSLDAATGNATIASNFGSNASLQSLAFRSFNGRFYSVNLSGSDANGHLVTADLNAGTIASVAGVPHGLPGQVPIFALAFAPGGELYGIFDANPGGPFGSPNYKLASFNVNSGLGSAIGSIGSSSQSFQSLRFDSAGTAYTVDANSGNVYTLNLANGQGTLLFAGGAAALGTTGLAFVPEPGAALLLALGAMLVICQRS
jgi:hypothetical protein